MLTARRTVVPTLLAQAIISGFPLHRMLHQPAPCFNIYFYDQRVQGHPCNFNRRLLPFL